MNLQLFAGDLAVEVFFGGEEWALLLCMHMCSCWVLIVTGLWFGDVCIHSESMFYGYRTFSMVIESCASSSTCKYESRELKRDDTRLNGRSGESSDERSDGRSFKMVAATPYELRTQPQIE